MAIDPRAAVPSITQTFGHKNLKDATETNVAVVALGVACGSLVSVDALGDVCVWHVTDGKFAVFRTISLGQRIEAGHVWGSAAVAAGHQDIFAVDVSDHSLPEAQVRKIGPLSRSSTGSVRVAQGMILVGDGSGSVHAYRFDDGRFLRCTPIHSDCARCVRVMGSRLVTVSWDKTVAITAMNPPSQ